MSACPCGAEATSTCGACSRRLCTWHHAHNMLGEACCLPRCNAAWWGRLAQSAGGAVGGATTRRNLRGAGQ